MTASAALTPLDSFAAHDEPVNHVAFGGHGELMATADTELNLRLWRNREMIQQYDLRSISEKVRPTERIRGVLFTSDGQSMIVAAGEAVARINIASGELVPEWTYVAPRLFAFLVISPTSISVSERDILAASFDNGSLVIWDARGERTALIKHNAVPRTLAFLPDESIIGNDSFSVSVWRADQRKPIRQRPIKQRIYAMSTSSDGKYIALRHLFTTTIHDVATGEQIAEHKQGRGLPLLAFGPGTHVLAIGTQHVITLYNLDTGATARLSLDDAELISLTFAPDSARVFAGCSDGCVRSWDNPF